MDKEKTNTEVKQKLYLYTDEFHAKHPSQFDAFEVSESWAYLCPYENFSRIFRPAAITTKPSVTIYPLSLVDAQKTESMTRKTPFISVYAVVCMY